MYAHWSRKPKRSKVQKKFGGQLTAETIYEMLKVLRSKQNTTPIVTDVNLLTMFCCIQSLQSTKLPATNLEAKVLAL